MCAQCAKQPQSREPYIVDHHPAYLQVTERFAVFLTEQRLIEASREACLFSQGATWGYDDTS